MEDFISDPMVIAVTGASVGALLTWLLPPLWKKPEQRRLEEVQKVTFETALQSPVFQNTTGDQRNIIVNFVAASTSANSHYISTGQGNPIVPDVQRWLQSAPAEGARPITRFSGEVDISHAAYRRAEVFYPAVFVRPPALQLTPVGGRLHYTLDQRADGFKVEGQNIIEDSERGVVLKWTADGELSVYSVEPPA